MVLMTVTETSTFPLWEDLGMLPIRILKCDKFCHGIVVKLFYDAVKVLWK